MAFNTLGNRLSFDRMEIVSPRTTLLKEPTVELTEPWQDPPHTIRATSVDQMYTVTMTGSLEYEYEVGLEPNFAPVTLIVENLSISNDLSVELTLPSFASSSTSSIVVKPSQTGSFSVSFNEADAKTRSLRVKKFFDEPSILNVTPLLVNGPVYVKSNFPGNA